jgi:ligand-binding sensor domain-containing protein
MMGNAIHKPIEPRMRCGLYGLMFFILLLFSGTVPAQDPLYRSYNTTSGLCGNQVFEMLQDRKGYLWFSTNQGISRFDGRNFKNFTGESDGHSFYLSSLILAQTNLKNFCSRTSFATHRANRANINSLLFHRIYNAGR